MDCSRLPASLPGPLGQHPELASRLSPVERHSWHELFECSDCGQRWELQYLAHGHGEAARTRKAVEGVEFALSRRLVQFRNACFAAGGLTSFVEAFDTALTRQELLSALAGLEDRQASPTLLAEIRELRGALNGA